MEISFLYPIKIIGIDSANTIPSTTLSVFIRIQIDLTHTRVLMIVNFPLWMNHEV